jgi:hypothetical protein
MEVARRKAINDKSDYDYDFDYDNDDSGWSPSPWPSPIPSTPLRAGKEEGYFSTPPSPSPYKGEGIGFVGNRLYRFCQNQNQNRGCRFCRFSWDPSTSPLDKLGASAFTYTNMKLPNKWKD